MATLTGGSSLFFVVDMDAEQDLVGTVLIHTPSVFRVTTGAYTNEFTSATGNFTYDASGNLIGGTITGWTNFRDDVETFTVTDISYPAASLHGVIDAAFYTTLFSGNDQATGTPGLDYLVGYGGSDTLSGLEGDDQIDGRSGADLMVGGLGSDQYVVDNPNDAITENPGEGVLDSVTSSVSYVLPANIEILQLTGSDPVNATGNDQDNSIWGNVAKNLLAGGGGNDTLIVGGSNDTFDGGSGVDVLDLSSVLDKLDLTLVQSPGNTVLDLTSVGLGVIAYRNIEGIISGWGNDSLVGTAQNDSFNGYVGDDTLRGGGGNDTLDGYFGNDVVDLSDAKGALQFTLPDPGLDGTADLTSAGLGTDTYRNIEGVIGGIFNDTLLGGSGFDTLDGGSGADSMAGGGGSDVYVLDNAGDVVKEAANQGTADTIESPFDYTLGANLENLTLIGAAAIDGTGNEAGNWLKGNDSDNALSGLAGDDTLNGNGGDDTLVGGAGVDLLFGGAGDDTYYIDEAGDLEAELVGEGFDTVYSSVNHILNGEVEQLILTGTAPIYGTGSIYNDIVIGNSAANVIYGYDGNDTLRGGGGADQVQGGIGDDELNGDEGDDQLSIDAGNDTLDGGAGIDQLVIGGAANAAIAITLIQSSSDTVIDLTAFGCGIDVYRNLEGVFGTEYDDTLSGGSGADRFSGWFGNDSLVGGGGNDTLDGSQGNDTLIGGAGINSLIGGDGDDRYAIDNATDSIVETASGGSGDEVFSSVALSAAFANVEHYTFTGLVGVDFTGNALDNRIAGTIAADTIDGASGNDTLLGSDGADILVGSEGDDFLDGGLGKDTLDGGGGNDVYVYDGAGDAIVDSGGFDVVLSASSIDLTTIGPAAIERVVLDETGDIDAIGNRTSNELIGNSFDNLLAGVSGNDTLDGWIGNDSLDGGLGNDFLLGFDGDDTLVGGAGMDALVGEQGSDLLLGGAGADAYGYDSLVDGADSVKTGDNGVDRVFLFGSDLWDWDFDRIGNDLLITALVDASDVYDESRTIRIVDQYAGAGIAYFEGDFGTDGNLFYGGNPDLTRVYTPGTLTGKNQGANAELIAGTPGDDKIVGNGGQSDWLYGGGGNDSIVGGSTAGGLAWLFGNAGNDTLGGGSGNNRLSGGEGDDLYIVDSAGDTVNELGSDANDELRTNQVLSGVVTNIEHYTFTGAAAVNFSGDGAANRLTGTAKNDTLNGAGGDDTLDGKAGDDDLVGGIGNDTYVVDNAKDIVDESGGDGTDKVQSFIAYVLAAGLENLELLGSGAINGTGNDVANELTGNKGANKLDGMGGADTMAGGGGGDTYIVKEAGDQVIETIAGAAGGIDLVLSAVSFDLSLAGREHVEKLTLTGGVGDNINATGNGLANTLTGNAGNNKLDGQGGADRMAGGLGNDTYVVDLKTDVVTEAAKAGTDTVQSFISYVLGVNLENLELQGLLNIDGTGNTLDNKLTGNGGNNRLDGKTGADTMVGGLGNDTYVIDNAGDIADETGGGGIDTIMTPFAAILGAEFENLTLTGAAAIAGTGNDKANVILGNGGANVLSGLGENDSLAGGAGNDSLDGGTGNDRVDGGTGADNLTGGAGDDTYVVDNAKDVVSELPGGGLDTVESSVSHILAAEVENLTLKGAGAVNGTGNALANMIVGNSAANSLSGGAGNDTLDGGKGADKLTGGDGSDTFVHHSLADGKDTITDFHTGPGGDVLDISDLLVGYTAGHEAEFVQCVTVAGNTTVKVDADGLDNGAKFTDVCVLTGVATDLGTLIADDNIQLG